MTAPLAPDQIDRLRDTRADTKPDADETLRLACLQIVARIGVRGGDDPRGLADELVAYVKTGER